MFVSLEYPIGKVAVCLRARNGSTRFSLTNLAMGQGQEGFDFPEGGRRTLPNMPRGVDDPLPV